MHRPLIVATYTTQTVAIIICIERATQHSQRRSNGLSHFFTLNLVMVITAAINLVMVVNSFSLFGNGHPC